MSSVGKALVAVALSIFLAGTSQVQASEAPKEVGSIRSIQITEITSIEKISEHVGENPMDSRMEVEITGVYEGHGQKDNVVGRIETNRSSGETISGELKLFSVDTTPSAMSVGGGFITALSRPTPFKVVVKMAPSMWMPSGNAFFKGPQTGMMWEVSAKVRKYQPVQYEHTYGFSASLFHSPERKAWNFYAFGLKQP